MTGPACSGRSTLAASILAEATQHGASCAYVDAADAFDPLSAAAIGINLALCSGYALVGPREAVCEGEEIPSRYPPAEQTQVQRRKSFIVAGPAGILAWKFMAWTLLSRNCFALRTVCCVKEIGNPGQRTAN